MFDDMKQLVQISMPQKQPELEQNVRSGKLTQNNTA